MEEEAPQHSEDHKSANFVYVVHPQHAWIPAQVVERPSPSEAIVKIPEYLDEQAIVCDGGRAAKKYSAPQSVDLNQYSNAALPLQNVDPQGRLSVVEDMVDLPFLHEAAILYNLKARHSNGNPYTRTGDIVIAVNPYKWFHDLYTLQQQYYYGQLLVWDPTTGNPNAKASKGKASKGKTPKAKASDPPLDPEGASADQNAPPNSQDSNSNSNSKSKTDHPQAPLDPRVLLPPHVYEASCLAYKGLLLDAGDQSILVSGESGAGKTETVKILLGDLASVQKGPRHPHQGAAALSEDPDDRGIVAKVLDSNPLLEAFGNAKTLRNDNSSRFGKYLQLQFDRVSSSKCVLAGSKSEVYLLEKSRVTLHNNTASEDELAAGGGERTYHIFYQLLAAPEDYKEQIWSGLANTDCESFDYVGWTNTHTIEGKTDADRFGLTLQALQLIGLEPDLLRHLWRTICVVLQLGNLAFSPDPNNPDASVLEDEDELEALAELMMGNPIVGQDPRAVDGGFEVRLSHLRTALTIRNVEARSETFKVPLSADRAKESTDAFAKEIYAKTFLWLVRTINDATCAENNYQPSAPSIPSPRSGGVRGLLTGRSSFSTGPTTPKRFGIIGLLDIFGFETFEVNRFEQLCINYANEKLQQKFTQDIFRSVQAEYEMEGIELEEITYDDNTDVLDLVEGRMGLLAFLNEECVRPKGSDKTFVYKAQAMNKDNPCFFRKPHAPDCEFGIKHYAGDVVYDATSFVVKNSDTLPSDLQDCARASTNPILANELSNETSENPPAMPASGPGGTKKKRRPKKAAPAPSELTNKKQPSSNLVAKTVWTKFKSQLSHLMETLSQTQTRYIRCIKPNPLKAPKLMDHSSTVEQLRCAGVVAAVTISRSAFPNRLEHLIVLERFKALWPKGGHLEILQNMALDPEERTSKATEALLTTALKEMEFIRSGHKYRAFVMGRTRAYFRAGALEYLEGERVNHLGTYAIVVQKHARGYRGRKNYQAFLKATIALQSGFRRRVHFIAYRRLYAAVVRVQCWHRVLHASAALVRLRRNFMATRLQVRWRINRDQRHFSSLKVAAVVVQATIRGALQRPRYRKALQEKKEEAKLENQLRILQRKLEEAETKRIEAEKEAEARTKAAVEEATKQQEERSKAVAAAEATKRREEENRKNKAEEEEKKRREKAEQEKANLAEQKAEIERDQQMQEEQQQLMDESGRMLEYLRQEVFKLRSQNQQIKADFDLLKDNNQRLMDANASAGASFAALNQHAKQMSKQNAQLANDMNGYKAQIQKLNLLQVELKDELKMKQVSYVAEVQSRLQYQRALTKITDLIQEECRDHRLVEKVLQVTDECEMEYMNMDPHEIPPPLKFQDGMDSMDGERRSSLFGYFFK